MSYDRFSSWGEEFDEEDNIENDEVENSDYYEEDEPDDEQQEDSSLEEESEESEEVSGTEESVTPEYIEFKDEPYAVSVEDVIDVIKCMEIEASETLTITSSVFSKVFVILKKKGMHTSCSYRDGIFNITKTKDF